MRTASGLRCISPTCDFPPGARTERNPTRAPAGVYRRPTPDRSQGLREALRNATSTRGSTSQSCRPIFKCGRFGRQDYRTMARIASNESIGTDRGDAIVGAMVVHLRQQSILLPSAAVLEKIALAARARARKQAYKALTAGVDQAVREKLDALIQVADGETRTAFAWLREWPEAPVQKNLAAIVERLQLLRTLGIGPD